MARRLVLLFAALLALVALTPATSTVDARNRARASLSAAPIHARADRPESSCTRPTSIAASPRIAVGCCVATKAGRGDASARRTAARSCSFGGATTVLMANGRRKPIEDVMVGDKVIATDPETGEHVPKRVGHVWVHDDTVGGGRRSDHDPFDG